MAGAYCKFCGHRCFVLRVVPDGPHKGWSGHMATCRAGMEHDLKELGHTHLTAVNPVTEREAAAAIAAEVRGEAPAAVVPPAPSGVRLVSPDGTEYPCQCTWKGTDDDGIQEWEAVPDGPVRPAPGPWTVRAGMLPARTALTVVMGGAG